METIDDLRSELFATLRALRDKENPMAIERAQAISGVAQTIINSAKVEVDMLEAVGPKHMQPTGFMVSQPKDTLQLQQEEEARIRRGPKLTAIPASMTGRL